MKNDDHCPDRDAVPTAADLASTDGLLEHYKRVSLGHQARLAAWQLGALVRRVEREAPEAHRRLLDAVKVLQQLAETPNKTLPVGFPRQGELF